MGCENARLYASRMSIELVQSVFMIMTEKERCMDGRKHVQSIKSIGGWLWRGPITPTQRMPARGTTTPKLRIL